MISEVGAGSDDDETRYVRVCRGREAIHDGEEGASKESRYTILPIVIDGTDGLKN